LAGLAHGVLSGLVTAGVTEWRVRRVGAAADAGGC
jgi:hypothetical protein